MVKVRSWASYPADYRQREVQILLAWVRAGVSGALVGGPGAGKSNLLGYLCHRPDIVAPAVDAPASTYLIALDLNNLPVNDLSNLYRAILRAFYEARERFDVDLRQALVSLFQEHRGATDPFVAQSALREWLLQLHEQGMRVVLVIDRFDWFCKHASADMADTLRGLRDSFKETISFIVGTRRELRYFADRQALGELYELLDTYTCWIQPMEERDARRMALQEAREGQVPQEAMRCLLALSGCHPALLKTACHWWLSQPDPPSYDHWPEALLDFPAMAHRLERLWQSLTLVEQQALQDLYSSDGAASSNRRQEEERRRALVRLQVRGILRKSEGTWQLRGALLAAKVAALPQRVPGSLWLDAQSDLLYQGTVALEGLSPLEGALLSYLVKYPYLRHTHTELIEAAWPEDTLRAGVSTEALYQVVRGIRRKIEPRPSHPRYVVNWRGIPEGGYRCFPEGMPE